jgi:type I restriction enzyme R subunit
MNANEADARASLVDPAIYKRGWTDELIRREETPGAIDIVEGQGRRRGAGRIDYTLRIQVTPDTQPVAVALLEATNEEPPPGHGLNQTSGAAACKRFNVPFLFSFNGHSFIEFNRLTGAFSAPRSLAEFPTPAELRTRYEQAVGFGLASAAARPLLQPYPDGEKTRRYYQDAAIRAVLEKIARCEVRGDPKRALLALPPGTGKTFTAVNLLKRVADAGQLKRALLVCGCDELRTQALRVFQQVFGPDAADPLAIDAGVHVATYQTLGVDHEDGEATLLTSYSEDSFTHVVIDECHRPGWGEWSRVLTRNPSAVHIGLTATPRLLADRLRWMAESEPWRTEASEGALVAAEDTAPYHVPGAELAPLSGDARADAEVCAETSRYFGEPVYEYDLAQAIADGYLAACEIRKGRINLDDTEFRREEMLDRKSGDPRAGPLSSTDQPQGDDRLLLPERVFAMCTDLFLSLLETGGPEQKTIILCAGDRQAGDVAACLNSLYGGWCRHEGNPQLDSYAFNCSGAKSDKDAFSHLCDSARSHFIATIVDLPTNGPDVPCVQNIVFFRHVNSPIKVYQMVGRGARIDVPSGKLMFRVHDYTGATRLLDQVDKARDARRASVGPLRAESRVTRTASTHHDTP